jgi:Rho termination factor, N-terminal domain
MSKQPEDVTDKSEQKEETAATIEESLADTQDKSSEPGPEPVRPEKKSQGAKQKPLEKMTVKELREMAKDIPQVVGVHGMKKEELIVEIKKAKGIADEPVKKADATVAQLKQKIKALKIERQSALEAKDKKKATIFKRRISRLKKRTRRLAA